MVLFSAEKKSTKKRKDEKRELYSGWESSGADNGHTDNNALHDWQESKQQEKCRYLDERNIVLSPHLTVKSWFSGSEGNDVAEILALSGDTSQDNAPTNKSSVALPDLSQITSDMYIFPINSMSTYSMTHKHNIIYNHSPSSLELKQSQMLIRGTPASHKQTLEESVPWQCKGFTPMKPAVSLRCSEGPAAKGLGWCHKNLAKLAHLGVQSPKIALPAGRHRPVIRRPVAGHKGVQVHNRHVQKSLSRTAASKGPLNGGGTRPATLLAPRNQELYSHVGRAVQAEAEGCGNDLEQEDCGLKLHINNINWLSDMLCSSECHGKDVSFTISHDITLFHILQGLQSKPGNFLQIRGQRRLETLPSLNA